MQGRCAGRQSEGAKVNRSVGRSEFCVCVYARVCFNGLHKFAIYETNAGGFVRLLEFSFLETKINLLSMRNASQLFVSPSA